MAAGRRGTDAPARARLNLTAIEQTLRHVQAELARPDGSLGVPRDPLDDRVIANLIAGYALVDTLVADEIDIFAMGQLKHILELNALVLCGTDAARRAAYTRHRDATERHFYELRDGGIRDVVEWHAAHRNDPPRDRAAGLYVRMLCHPQLFIEGNHRTGALIMSYVMLARRRAPVRPVSGQRRGVLRRLHRPPEHRPQRSGGAATLARDSATAPGGADPGLGALPSPLKS